MLQLKQLQATGILWQDKIECRTEIRQAPGLAAKQIPAWSPRRLQMIEGCQSTPLAPAYPTSGAFWGHGFFKPTGQGQAFSAGMRHR